MTVTYEAHILEGELPPAEPLFSHEVLRNRLTEMRAEYYTLPWWRFLRRMELESDLASMEMLVMMSEFYSRPSPHKD